MTYQGRPVGTGTARRPDAEEAFGKALARAGGFTDATVGPAYGKAPTPEPYAFTHSSSISDPDELPQAPIQRSVKGRD